MHQILCTSSRTSIKNYRNYMNSTVKNLTYLFCPGQNKNITVVKFLMALLETGHFTVIKQHSFLPWDMEFGLIMRVLCKAVWTYTIVQYHEFIMKAPVRKNKFSILQVTQNDITDWKDGFTFTRRPAFQFPQWEAKNIFVLIILLWIHAFTSRLCLSKGFYFWTSWIQV